MTIEHSQHENADLVALYARLGHSDVPAWLDAEVLAAHVDGRLSPALAERVQAAIDASPALAALHASLVDLAPHSEMLAQSLAEAPCRQGHRGGRTARVATRHAVRRTTHRHIGRWAGTAAALLLAVAGVWTWQQLDDGRLGGQHTATVQPAFEQAAQPDTIFDSGMDRNLASGPEKSDEDGIFRSNFNRKS